MWGVVSALKSVTETGKELSINCKKKLLLIEPLILAFFINRFGSGLNLLC